jgi:hypothetical protein
MATQIDLRYRHGKIRNFMEATGKQGGKLQSLASER